MTFPHEFLPLLHSSPTLRRDSTPKSLSYSCPASHSDPDLNTILFPDLDIVFPPAKPIAHEIESLGVDSITASTFSDAYLSMASSLRERCKHFVRQSTSSLQSSTPDITMKYMLSIRRRCRTIYQHSLNTWKSSTLRKSHQNSKARQTFKRDGLPLLLRYFDHNMYPSPADKIVLAKKTGLTSRQIETWFQNHRNRTPKFLKRVGSRETPFNFDLSEDPPSNQGPRSQLPATHKESQPPTRKISRVVQRPSVLDNSTHPSTSKNLFNPLEPFFFEESDWPRPPQPSPQPRRKVVFDIDNFCRSFQNSLNLRCNHKQSHSDVPSEKLDSSPWTSLHRTVLFPNHHPALVRTLPPATPPQRQQSVLSVNSTIALRPRTYKPLPRRLCLTAFLKYQKEEGRMNVLAAYQYSPAISDSPLTPTLLRRSLSASSVDTSVTCATPVSFSNSVSIVLQQFDDTLVSCAMKDGPLAAVAPHSNTKRPRLLDHSDFCS